MEQTNSKSLPPIFKLSSLCNILPYFGYLHEWKNLLESISMGTNHIWNENRAALMYCEHETEESTPSPMCTSLTSNITEFEEDKVADLCKHIYEKVKSRKVVLKKREDNIIEVNSVVPHSIPESEDNNLLSSDYEKVEDNFSCPVDNCICKPVRLCCCPFKITKEIDQSKFESLTEETSEEITRKICDLSTTKYIKQLKVSNMIKDFSSFENLLKLKEMIPNIVIVFDFKYEKTKYLHPSCNFKMNCKAVTCVFKGRDCEFEIIYGHFDHICCFSDIKQIENSNYAVLKIDCFDCNNLVMKERNCVDDCRKSYIDELKKNTETNDDLFIIADLNNLEIHLWVSEIEEYSLHLKYFKHITIWISLSVLRNKGSIEKINNLPKQHHYEVRTYYKKDNKYDFLNLIDPRFEKLSICYSRYPYEIKIKRSNSTSNELVSKWSISTINTMNRRMTKTDSEYFIKLLFTM